MGFGCGCSALVGLEPPQRRIQCLPHVIVGFPPFRPSDFQVPQASRPGLAKKMIMKEYPRKSSGNS